MKAILPFLALALQASAADRFSPAKGRVGDNVQLVCTVRLELKLKGNDILRTDQASVLGHLGRHSVAAANTIDELKSP